MWICDFLESLAIPEFWVNSSVLYYPLRFFRAPTSKRSPWLAFAGDNSTFSLLLFSLDIGIFYGWRRRVKPTSLSGRRRREPISWIIRESCVGHGRLFVQERIFSATTTAKASGWVPKEWQGDCKLGKQKTLNSNKLVGCQFSFYLLKQLLVDFKPKVVSEFQHQIRNCIIATWSTSAIAWEIKRVATPIW